MLKSAEYREKDKTTIPIDAKILKKSTRISVEEIENGFILVKSIEVEYEVDEENHWKEISKKYFSKTNPLDIDINPIGEKSLAEKFE